MYVMVIVTKKKVSGISVNKKVILLGVIILKVINLLGVRSNYSITRFNSPY